MLNAEITSKSKKYDSPFAFFDTLFSSDVFNGKDKLSFKSCCSQSVLLLFVLHPLSLFFPCAFF